MAKKTGIFYRAVPDSGQASVMVNAQNKLNLGFPNCFIPTPRIEKLIGETAETLWFPIKDGTKVSLPKQPWFINFCADADEYSRAMTYLKHILSKTGAPVFNHPDAVMNSRRDKVAALLQDIPNLTTPRCVRFTPKMPDDFVRTFEESGLSYPVLVRPIATQSGVHLVRIDNSADWDKVHSIPWGGHTLHMTQFVDFATPEGEYLKIRAVCAGDRIFIRHVLISDNWLVHAMDRTDAIVDREFALHEELQKSETFKSVVSEIRTRIGLDFFGIDLGWSEADQFVLFEANAAMSILSNAHMPTYRRADYLKILKEIEEGVVRTIRKVQFRAARGG
ncbi:hypothetical protein [Yoonia litorea]|uniref:ATP-grasp domain-containing protein n=1 Tax=Yoonia litorea TaxID=1123755 RepID=A0A1I6MV23_9RHOB|nr:hypothetical protein [Yoonia litorea]SFS19489.1 hypothetical protein SAMN05444714_2207 [Yoonia litorea]